MTVFKHLVPDTEDENEMRPAYREEKIAPQENLKSVCVFLELAGKYFPLLVFVASLIGSMQMWFFATTHQINFIDLITANVSVAFGVTYILFVSLFAFLFYVMVANTNHQSNFLYRVMIRKSPIKIIREKPVYLRSFMSFIVSLWPLFFLLPESEIVWCLGIYLVIIAVIFTLYHNITSDLDGLKWYHLRRFRCAIFIFLPVISLIVTGISLYAACDFLMEKFPGVQAQLFAFILCGGLFFMNFTSFEPPGEDGKSRQPLSYYLLLSFFVSFLFIPGPWSDYTPDNVIRILGIGLEKRCYQPEEVRNIKIPSKLIQEYNGIIQLSIVANPGSVYYIAQPDDADMHARFRFVATDFKQIQCVKKSATYDSTYL